MEMGADFVKVFRLSPMGGAHYARALRPPFPQILLIAGGRREPKEPQPISFMRAQMLWALAGI